MSLCRLRDRRETRRDNLSMKNWAGDGKADRGLSAGEAATGGRGLRLENDDDSLVRTAQRNRVLVFVVVAGASLTVWAFIAGSPSHRVGVPRMLAVLVEEPRLTHTGSGYNRHD